jgi:hypothetical protein
MSNQLTLPASFGPMQGAALPMYMTEAEHPFESFRDYLLRVVFPVISYIPAVTTIRCSISGFPIATLAIDEIREAFLAACITMEVDEQDHMLSIPSPERVADVCDLLMAHMRNRIMILSRPAPSLLMNNDKFILAHLSEEKQFSVLLNLFLNGTHLFQATSGEQLERLELMAAVADLITATDATQTEEGRACFDALLQLDAVHGIKTLTLTRAERDALIKMRAAGHPSLGEIAKLVSRLIAAREGQEPVNKPSSWSGQALRQLLSQPDYQLKHSNILADLVKKNKASNAHIAAAKKAERDAKRRAEQEASMTPEQKRKRAFADFFAKKLAEKSAASQSSTINAAALAGLNLMGGRK